MVELKPFNKLHAFLIKVKEKNIQFLIIFICYFELMAVVNIEQNMATIAMVLMLTHTFLKSGFNVG